tara:strand:- start:502 stop:1278 length:777 start_codon:yes stop_codon:yes gene_type:complete
MVLFLSRNDVLNKNIPDNLLGVYYFLDLQDNILYIGKSIDIKKRISQHLSKGRKRLINTFSKLKVKKLNTELESLLFESQEIKKYRPIFNRRLRRSKNYISLLTSKDEKGYHYYKLSDDCNEDSLINFVSKRNAHRFILNLTQKHNLCEKINGLDKSSKSCFQYHLKNCNGACLDLEDNAIYNLRFQESYENILRYPFNCKLVFTDSKTYVIIKNNKVCEFGVESISKWIVNYPSNDEIRIVNTFKNRISNKVKQIMF